MADAATAMTKRLSRMSRSVSAESASAAGEMLDPLRAKRKLKRPKERWLLTRKTWRYMADAGRKLIPDGAQNRADDLPKIEAYFQEVCKREPRFLLWRKNSYPGALSFRKKKKSRAPGGSCRKASSADEALDLLKPDRPKDLPLYAATSGGRFDIQKMKYDFLNAPPPAAASPRTFLKNKETYPPSLAQSPDDGEEEEEQALIAMLEQYLKISDDGADGGGRGGGDGGGGGEQRLDFNYQELVDKLQRHLTLTNIPQHNDTMTAPAHVSSAPLHSFASSSSSFSSKFYTAPSVTKQRQTVHFEGDHVQKSLQETLSRYFSASPSRDRIISDLLTNRKALQKLYFDLRQTKSFRGRRDYTAPAWEPPTLRHYRAKLDMSDYRKSVPPPLIEIQGESTEAPACMDSGTQTVALSEGALAKLEEDYRKLMAERQQEEYDAGRGGSGGHRRRSSVDHDDVSQSVSDHIKRYLRMARKKSSDADKVDRFKRVNYDRNLRNIKAKGEITKPGDDDGLHKGCQTNEEWILIYRDLKLEEIGGGSSSARSSIDAGVVLQTSSPTSPTKSSHSFLASLLHHNKDKDKDKEKDKEKDKSVGVATGVTATSTSTAIMQKSKSSSSVVHQGGRLMAQKIFKRSKSQSRPTAAAQQPCTWTPKGACCWNSVHGRQVVLADATLQQLSEIERKVLQKVALAKLQALNLGVSVKIPSDATLAVPQKKRRPYLIKRKALTTGLFDSGRKDDKDKQGSGLVFGIALAQCVENDRASRMSTSGYSSSDTTATTSGVGGGMPRTSSRASFSSLIEGSTMRGDDKGSCESLSHHRIAGSVPGLLDELSTSSAADIIAADEERAIPHMVSECIRHLEANGLHTLGLFRVSPSKKRVRELRESFDSGKETQLSADQCPHDVATLLKEFLRDLPDPLLCRDLYNAFVQTQRIRNRRLQLEALQHLVQLLPAVNRDTLAALLQFLAKVARNANDQQAQDAHGEPVAGNKMNSTNLATIFAPNILHALKAGSAGKEAGKEASSASEDRLDVINVIRTMIDYAGALFACGAELLDEVYVHMMDTHPAALEALMNNKMLCDESQDEVSDGGGGGWPSTMRKTYSREECLHESAATGGPNVAMRLRHKERSVRRRRESSSHQRHGHGDDESSYSKTRSSSLESNSSEQQQTTLRIEDGSRRQSTPFAGVITASLTIPVQLDADATADIPYIEDGAFTVECAKRSPTAPPRRRQRSMSGSDSSSVASIAQPITGSILVGGYDSAIGSSIAQSAINSPPHIATPSSVGSSSMDASGVCSSPPSWASTPPTSPDSHQTTVNYIPDDGPLMRQFVKQAPMGNKSTAAILQKVSYTSTSEIQRASKPADIRRDMAPTTPSRKKSVDGVQPSISPMNITSAAFAGRDRFNPSITSIGNAVLRSRTADFERITQTTTETKTTTATTTVAEKKKYTKRRYTDLRHQTRHIPDAEALMEATQKQAGKTISTAAIVAAGSVAAAGSMAAPTAVGGGGGGAPTTTVYKRRELISSAPSAGAQH